MRKFFDSLKIGFRAIGGTLKSRFLTVFKLALYIWTAPSESWPLAVHLLDTFSPAAHNTLLRMKYLSVLNQHIPTEFPGCLRTLYVLPIFNDNNAALLITLIVSRP